MAQVLASTRPEYHDAWETRLVRNLWLREAWPRRTFAQFGGVGGVAFTPDGTGVLTGGYDRTARLWDAETGAVAEQNLDASAWASLLGNGPGTMPKLDAFCADGVETTYAKAIFEYGLAGALAFGVLIIGALNRSAAPVRIRVALGVMWLLLGGNLLTSEFLLLIFLFSAMWPEGSAANHRGPRP